ATVCCAHLQRVLQLADLRDRNPARFRFGSGDENLPRFCGKNFLCWCAVNQARHLRSERLLTAARWSRDQIRMREPVLLISAPQVFECCCTREGHLDVRCSTFDVRCFREQWKPRTECFPNLVLDLVRAARAVDQHNSAWVA